VQPRYKFILGGILVVATAGYLMASSIRDTAMYYLTPSELEAKVAADESFRDVGVKVGANVVPGSIDRHPGGRGVTFTATDGTKELRVVYTGLIPDTFSDSAEVVVEGRLGDDDTFQATVLLAKCASRFEIAPENPAYQQPGYESGTPGYKSGAPGYKSGAAAGAVQPPAYKSASPPAT
jgi:cytochrome c-type biogenesis protein CcmE